MAYKFFLSLTVIAVILISACIEEENLQPE